MDTIKEAAESYARLLNVEYSFLVGRKGKSMLIKLTFEPEDFKHISGLHKLKDLNLDKVAAGVIWSDINRGILTDEKIEKSISYEDIKNRLLNIKYLEKYLDNNMLIFKWDIKRSFSKIVADYMLKEKTEDSEKAYVFLKEKTPIFSSVKKVKVDSVKMESPISFFLDCKDYSYSQMQYTLLKNSKKNLETGEILLLYDNEVFRNKNSNNITEKEIKDQATNKITIQSKTKLMIKEESEKVKQSTYDLSNEN